ncbi:GxGYxYP domain-containing protein [Paenibacillus spongiae]|uniref:GxGYxY sequence motif-containing protein n=1 Tax=Paenibacillus spongiae TaxID=2909671 RepID=A0ABY5SGZ6_9BACL|nr:GxGYxYP domain-containing protein [Paenibacillus spongiae]UVI33249.1 hypothetical protein L1F29_16005 [Paenibacillus spongiae]
MKGLARSKVLLVITLLLTVISPALASADGTNEDRSNHSGVTWPKNQELPTFSKPKFLDVVDLAGQPGEMELLLTSLQGNVNREKTRIYVLEGNAEEGRMTWLNEFDVPYQVHVDPLKVVAKYKNEVKGIVVYDPDNMDTVNLATTYAGLENAIVASPGLADVLTAAPYNLPLLEDYRGKFANAMEVYQWQYDNFWNRTTKRMLIGLSGGNSIPLPPGIPDSYELLLQEDEEIRNSSNRAVHEIDLTSFLGEEAVYLRFDDAFTADGWGPAVHEVTVKADGNVIGHFIPGTEAGTAAEKPFLYDSGRSALTDRTGGHRFADGNSYFVYRFAPPEGTQTLTVSVDMWNQYKVSATNVQTPSSDNLEQEPYGFLRDYAVANRAMVFWLDPNDPEERVLFEKILSDVEPGTPYLGWFANDVAGEWGGTELCSQYGVYVLASDWFNNMTVFSGMEGKIKKQKQLEAPALENKIYVTFTYTDGDNLQYNQHGMKRFWDDPGRGSVPINWSVSPLLADAAPFIFGHFLGSATDNDLLIAGPSGMGYFYPDAWPEQNLVPYLQDTHKYLKRAGIDIIYALNIRNHQNAELSERTAQAFIDELNLNGMFLNWKNSNEMKIVNDSLPVSTGIMVGSVNQAKEAIASASEGWDGTTPRFITIGAGAWSLRPSDIAEVASSLGTEYKVVRGDQYFDLVREANGLDR